MQAVAVVIPCYNEAERLDLQAFRDSLDQQPSLTYVFVNDGSQDRTQEMLDAFAAERPARVRVLRLERNSGKAEAVRRGVLYAGELGSELIGYWDADLATPLSSIPQFVSVLSNPEVLLVLGSRVQLLGKRINRRAARHYLGRIFATVASRLLSLSVYDTQCGAKLMRATPQMLSLFQRPFQLSWCFDVELLARLLGLQARGEVDVERRCVELPLDTWEDATGSKLSPRQIPKVLAELLRLPRIVAAERKR